MQFVTMINQNRTKEQKYQIDCVTNGDVGKSGCIFLASSVEHKCHISSASVRKVKLNHVQLQVTQFKM